MGLGKRHAKARATHIRRTYQAFNLFATGIVSPRVALFRKPNPTSCTLVDGGDATQGPLPRLIMPPSPPPAPAPPSSPATDDDEFDSLHVGLVITLGVLAVVLLLTVSVVVHLIRMVRPAPSPVPSPVPAVTPRLFGGWRAGLGAVLCAVHRHSSTHAHARAAPAAGEEGQPALHAAHEGARRRGRAYPRQGRRRQLHLGAKNMVRPAAPRTARSAARSEDLARWRGGVALGGLEPSTD